MRLRAVFVNGDFTAGPGQPFGIAPAASAFGGRGATPQPPASVGRAIESADSTLLSHPSSFVRQVVRNAGYEPMLY